MAEKQQVEGPVGMTGKSGPALSTFYVRHRVTHPTEIATVQAETTELAIHQVLAMYPDDQVEVLETENAGPTAPSGATGATGGTGATGMVGR